MWEDDYCRKKVGPLPSNECASVIAQIRSIAGLFNTQHVHHRARQAAKTCAKGMRGGQHAFCGMQPRENRCNSTTSRAFSDFFCSIESARLVLSNYLCVCRVYEPEFRSFFAFSVKQAENAQYGNRKPVIDFESGFPQF